MTDNLNYINLVHGISNTRVYKIDNELFSYTASRFSIVPFSTTSIHDMAEYLLKAVSNENIQVELLFAFKKGSISKKTKTKMNSLMGIQEINLQLFIKYITLLL
jgi:hypothetical protein